MKIHSKRQNEGGNDEIYSVEVMKRLSVELIQNK
jgi:hypothetical protein